MVDLSNGIDVLRQKKEDRKRGAREVPGSAAPAVTRAATPPPAPAVIATAPARQSPAPASVRAVEAGSPAAVPDGGIGRAPVTRFWRNPENPREEGEFDLDSDDELKAMDASVKSYGILQSLSVVERSVWVHHHPEHASVIPEDIWYVIQLGSTRHYLAEHNGIEFLKFTRDDSLADPVRAIESRLIENFHRRTLNPIMEAKEIRRLIAEKGVSQRALAASIAYDPMAISRSLQLLKLIPEFQAIVVRGKPGEGELSPEKARPIAALPPEDQAKLFELGAPYLPTKLREPDSRQEPDGGGDEIKKVTSVRVSIPQGSGPDDVVKYLTDSIDPELLSDVAVRLSKALRRTWDERADSAEADGGAVIDVPA